MRLAQGSWRKGKLALVLFSGDGHSNARITSSSAQRVTAWNQPELVAATGALYRTLRGPCFLWAFHVSGYIIPGGVASACGSEPWMLTLLDEVQGLRDSGR